MSQHGQYSRRRSEYSRRADGEDTRNDLGTETERRSYVRLPPMAHQSHPRGERRPRVRRHHEREPCIEEPITAPPTFDYQPPPHNTYGFIPQPPPQPYPIPYEPAPFGPPPLLYGGVPAVPPGQFQGPPGTYNVYPDSGYYPTVPRYVEPPYHHGMHHVPAGATERPGNGGGWSNESVAGSSSSVEQEMNKIKRQFRRMKKENREAQLAERIRIEVAERTRIEVNNALSRRRESDLRGEYAYTRPRANSTELARRMPARYQDQDRRDKEVIVHQFLDFLDDR